MRSGEFLAGLLAQDDPAWVAAEDFDGPHGGALRSWQDLGYIGRDPGANPVPGCPHCNEGVPYRLGERYLCARCRSTVDPRHLLAWPVHREVVLARIAEHLQLRGGLQRIDANLWQLGTGVAEGSTVECFASLGSPLSASASHCLGRYVRVLVLHGPTSGRADGYPGRWVSLAELFAADGTLASIELGELQRPRGRVRFDPTTGTLRVGTLLAGEVPVGSREWAMLVNLAEQIDQYVPYAELKRAILRQTGGCADIDEATFCQKLKSRIKTRIPGIDRLVVTTNKGDGYRLRVEG